MPPWICRWSLLALPASRVRSAVPVLALAACGAPTGAGKAGAWAPTLGPASTVVPGPGLPADLPLQPANNNLDVVEHEGALFLAFRTAPDHFASPDAQLHVLRSDDDGESFLLEQTLAVGTDLREPRFLSHGGVLTLHYALLGDDPFAFEPQGTEAIRRGADGAWSAPGPIFDGSPAGVGGGTFIPWRTRLLDGAPMMIGYTGGGVLYDFATGEGATTVQWLTLAEGGAWAPWQGADPIVLAGGVSETDLAVDGEGRVVAVGRNEAGDEDGFGSKVCVAQPGAPMDWDCAHDPRRYDSPLVFAHEGEIWLVGRRNLNDQDGNFDLGMEELDPNTQSLTYAIDYWNWPKRCSLWRVDADALQVTWVADLESRGDTCFPSLRWRGPHRLELWSYSSPLDGPDLTWLEGQKGDTHVTMQEVEFVPAEG
jgi:hypothetical protein